MHGRNVLFLAAAAVLPGGCRRREPTPDALCAVVKSATAKWVATVKTAGIQPE